LRLRKYNSKERIEPAHYLASQLQVRKLVLAHRNNLSLIERNIGSHQNRITN
jgi:hypothetical protein